MHIDKRTRARELAIQALYQLDVQGAELLPRLMGEFFTVNEPDERTRKLAWEWTQGTWEHVEVCDELIVTATIRWQFSRLSPVDKSILRLAVYQLKCCSDIPPKVVINEAIELAKKYSTEKSGPFVNGVLDAVLKRLNTNPQCMEDKPRSTG
ncbi:MAG: transcription antitermination factor NusB [Sedimentisphaerales bacterium]|jgi:N utilization substance protein B|nr:transcription antitermination factor NusB [Sedimentisphaerales bacterium]NLZ03854.1 transcription antitermination factor NusB [Phycisphaerae bacterium]HNY77562.1 transcription antitermination factor NusB [Sedimentisphaerales bacterium]HOC61895.1 transcription antitermination factor NusB [Sedimentisphaerales bacterium]HOH63737.1 transcription antitermination factor NusB [Sedimentisphaerales bacterium]